MFLEMSPPKKQICVREDCLRSEILEEKVIDLVKSSWSKPCESYNKLRDAGIEIIHEPFPVCIVQNVMSNTDLLKAVTDELKGVKFNEKSNDLYQFKQSDDLVNLSNFNAIQQLYDCIRQTGREWIVKVFGDIDLKEEISATFSSYGFHDRLLCHDDKCGDRHIAFILYLTENWQEEDGGALQLFSSGEDGYPEKVVKSIFPNYNSLVFFEVTYTSFHQVSEVLAKNKNRVSLNGWFHLKNKKFNEGNCKTLDAVKTLGNDKKFKFNDYFSAEYFEDDVIEDIRFYFTKNSETQLLGFLQPTFLDKVNEDLRSEKIKWLSKGPPNVRNYEVADSSTLSSALQTLKDIFESGSWFSFLKTLTKLDFAPSATSDLKLWGDGILPHCNLEIQRWVNSSYTLIHDKSSEFESEGLDMILRLPIKDLGVSKFDEDSDIPAGDIIYLDEESKNEECLLHLGNKKNCLALVFRDAKTLRFTKYLHSEAEPFYQLFCTYYQWHPPADQPNLRHCEDESSSEDSPVDTEDESISSE